MAKTRKPSTLVIIVVVVAGSIFVGLSPMLVRGVRAWHAANQAFDVYAAHMAKRQYESAYAMCSSELRDNVPFAVFSQQQRSIEKDFGTLIAIERTSRFEIRGTGTPITWEATFIAVHRYQNAKVRFAYALVFDGSAWQIDGYKQLDHRADGKTFD